MRYLLVILLLAFFHSPQAQPARPKKYNIGDSAFCGIVFFVEDLDSTGRQRGLVCAPADQHAGIRWFNGSYILTFAVQDHLYAKGNADTIIFKQGQGSYAAMVANSFQPDSFCTNWYLPSRTELFMMYTNIARSQSAAIKKRGKFKNEGYWSSFEATDSTRGAPGDERRAYIVDFFNGRTFPVNKANKYRVRAVREFRNFNTR